MESSTTWIIESSLLGQLLRLAGQVTAYIDLLGNNFAVEQYVSL